MNDRSELRGAFRTAEIEEATAYMSAAFSPHSAQKRTLNRSIKFQSQSVELDGIALHFVDYGCEDGDVVIRTPEVGPYFMFLLPLSGSALVSAGGPAQPIDTQCMAALSPKDLFFQRPGRDYTCLAIKVPAHVGSRYGFDCRTQPKDPLVGGWNVGQWTQVAETLAPAIVRSTFGRIDPLNDEPVQPAAIVENRILCMLQHLLASSPTSNAVNAKSFPPHLKRAIEFIKDNYASSVYLHEIAAASRVNVRTLQQSFRHYIGTSPMGFVHAVRMHHARQHLLASAGKPSHAKVTMTAMEHGFDHLGRFSGQYARQFGESPSDTLRFWRQ